MPLPCPFARPPRSSLGTQHSQQASVRVRGKHTTPWVICSHLNKPESCAPSADLACGSASRQRLPLPETLQQDRNQKPPRGFSIRERLRQLHASVHLCPTATGKEFRHSSSASGQDSPSILLEESLNLTPILSSPLPHRSIHTLHAMIHLYIHSTDLGA